MRRMTRINSEPYYRDFFAAPSHKAFSAVKAPTTAPSPEKPDKESKVRFHDEVRVKKIKSRGKGNSEASMKNMMVWEEEDDEDDEDDEEEDDEEDDDDEFEEELHSVDDHDMDDEDL